MATDGSGTKGLQGCVTGSIGDVQGCVDGGWVMSKMGDSYGLTHLPRDGRELGEQGVWMGF